MADDVATDVGEFGGRSLRANGHNFYCRKCAAPKELDGILLPDQLQDVSFFVEVLAIGPLVGRKRSKQRWSKAELKRFGYERQRNWKWEDDSGPTELKVGDFLFLPPTHPYGIHRSTLNYEDEFSIDEGVVLGIYRPPKEPEYDSTC